MGAICLPIMLSPEASLWHLALGHLALGTWWVLDHPARATWWVRAATTFMLLKEEDAQVYTYHRGQNLGEDGAMLPFLFWRVSIGRRRSPPSGAAEVSRGEPGCPERRRDAACLAFIFGSITLFRTFITIHAVIEELALVLH
jgi:hypothetical protein